MKFHTDLPYLLPEQTQYQRSDVKSFHCQNLSIVKLDFNGRAPFGIRRGCNKVYATSDAKVYRGCCLRVYTQNIMSS
jgi:hypothetical protein